MAELFVRLGSLHTVREVENYIITVGRVRITAFIFVLKSDGDDFIVSRSFL